jgi:hypothetical protein
MILDYRAIEVASCPNNRRIKYFKLYFRMRLYIRGLHAPIIG